MKKYISTFVLGGLLCAAAVAYASTLWVGSLTTVNNTTLNSATNSINTIGASPGSYLITDNGLSTTTAMTVNWQWSIDSNNFVTVFTWQAPNTNAGTFTVTPGVLSTNLFQRIQIVTTNSVQVGILQQ